MPSRTPWSRLRIASLAACLACFLLASAAYISSMYYTGDFDGTAEFWAVFLAGLAAFISFLAALVRDQVVAEVRPLRQYMDDLPLHIMDYGDRREVSGHKLAARVTETQNRRLSSVD